MWGGETVRGFLKIPDGSGSCALGEGLARDLPFQELVGTPLGPVAWTVARNQEDSNQNFVSIKTAISEDNRSH
jgi:hypothetical protein